MATLVWSGATNAIPVIHHLTPLDIYLVIVVMTMEERLLPEDHASQHTAKAPHIQTVVVHLKHTHTQSESQRKHKRESKQTKKAYPQSQVLLRWCIIENKKKQQLIYKWCSSPLAIRQEASDFDWTCHCSRWSASQPQVPNKLVVFISH